MCVHIYLSASPGWDFLCCSLCPGPWDRFEWAPCLSSKSSLLCAGMRRQLQWIYINPAPHVCKFNCKHLVMSQGRGRRKTCGKEATHLNEGRCGEATAGESPGRESQDFFFWGTWSLDLNLIIWRFCFLVYEPSLLWKRQHIMIGHLGIFRSMSNHLFTYCVLICFHDVRQRI